jgi:hypothetical protein
MPCRYKLLPYQERVLIEKIELDKLTKAVGDFISNDPIFENLDENEQERLKEQNEIMCK